MTNVFGEGLVQYFGFFLKDSGRDGDSRVAQTLETLPRNQWIGILHAGDHAANADRDNRVGAGPCAPLVGAGFEADVENSTAGLCSGLLQGQHFGVFDAGKPV